MRTRLPVRFKLAVVTAALTFGILCIFAFVILYTRLIKVEEI